MVVLQTRWKQKRSWNRKRYRSLALWLIGTMAAGGAILVVFFAVVKIAPGLLRSAVAPGLQARAVPANAGSGSSASAEPPLFDVGLVDRLGRKYTVSGYAFILPKDFNADVLPQPASVPRGGRFTGLRFRGPAGDAAQLFIQVIDDPTKNSEARTTEARLSETLERLFDRLTHNSAAVNFRRGKDQFGEINGLPCIRTGFSGEFRDARKRPRIDRYGIALATFESTREVCMYFFCEKTIDRETYRLLEASLSTLRRADTPRAGPGAQPEDRPGEAR